MQDLVGRGDIFYPMWLLIIAFLLIVGICIYFYIKRRKHDGGTENIKNDGNTESIQ